MPVYHIWFRLAIVLAWPMSYYHSLCDPRLCLLYFTDTLDPLISSQIYWAGCKKYWDQVFNRRGTTCQYLDVVPDVWCLAEGLLRPSWHLQKLLQLRIRNRTGSVLVLFDTAWVISKHDCTKSTISHSQMDNVEMPPPHCTCWYVCQDWITANIVTKHYKGAVFAGHSRANDI